MEFPSGLHAHRINGAQSILGANLDHGAGGGRMFVREMSRYNDDIGTSHHLDDTEYVWLVTMPQN